MTRLRAVLVSLAILVAPSAWAATVLSGASDATVGLDSLGISLRDAAARLDPMMLLVARSAAEGDEPFALDEDRLTSLGETGAAPKRNPFAWTLLLIAFAGLTAVFAGKRSGGRGLIGA